ncbi:hypothetical protein NXS19_006467 [Fusarium pseudograminearum]|nr:hypothetical protein NXS19_006467 [Fusarium pseudograminearum]
MQARSFLNKLSIRWVLLPLLPGQLQLVKLGRPPSFLITTFLSIAPTTSSSPMSRTLLNTASNPPIGDIYWSR